MTKYILFDFDGTLADSKEAFLAAFNQLAAREGFSPMQPEELPYLRTLTIPQRAKYLNFPLYKLPLLSVKMYRLYKQQLHTVQLFPGVKELLQELAQKGVQPVILSSNSESNIRAFLRQQGIGQVQEVLCSSRIFGKDRMLRRFLKEKKLAPAEVLYVGDELRDVQACQKCGVAMAWVSWGYDAWEVVQPAAPQYAVHSPQELLEIL